MVLGETLERPTTKERELEFLVGYYALILATKLLSPEWEELYRERLGLLQSEVGGE